MNYEKIMSGFPEKTILVVGDLMLDEFLWGEVSRISPEAPVPVVSATRRTRMPGGAGNVANNLAELGAKVHVIGVIGKDAHGTELSGLLREKGVVADGVVVDGGRSTTLKSRIIAKSQHVVRVDTEDRKPVGDAVLAEMKSYLEKILPEVDALAVSDYGKGVVSAELLGWLLPAAKASGIPVVVDPKIDHFPSYAGVTVIAPNEHEACAACNLRQANEESVMAAGARLLSELDCRAVLVTRGARGMSLFEKEGVTHIPAHAREVFDITGAGDTVTSVLALCLACGAGVSDAAHLANYAAGVVVGKMGTATVTLEEIMGEVSGGE
ncbi:MAG: D-glycero-beta-D-manno-heptose-7-phosphate kinase [Candidatus Altiarchaeota archaeon]